MNTEEMILRELGHIRCLLEGVWLDSKESKDGCELVHVQERCIDETKEYLISRTKHNMVEDG